MPSIEQRLQKIESTVKDRPLTKAEQEAREEAWFASYGTSQEEAIAQYGGVPSFAYAAMLGQVRPLNDQHPTPQPNDGLSPQERYMAMLNGKLHEID